MRLWIREAALHACELQAALVAEDVATIHAETKQLERSLTEVALELEAIAPPDRELLHAEVDTFRSALETMLPWDPLNALVISRLWARITNAFDER